MRFLAKRADSPIISNEWSYATRSHRHKIREVLMQEQQLDVADASFCAYTEAVFRPVDLAEIEHFDDRLKNTAEDDYWNWYAVHGRINRCKGRCERFQPMLLPHDPSLPDRIVYQDGQFATVEENDVRAQNLISFLGWNDPTLADYRRKHIERFQHDRQEFFEDNDEGFIEYMRRNPENLSFITVLEAELKITLTRKKPNND